MAQCRRQRGPKRRSYIVAGFHLGCVETPGVSARQALHIVGCQLRQGCPGLQVAINTAFTNVSEVSVPSVASRQSRFSAGAHESWALRSWWTQHESCVNY